MKKLTLLFIVLTMSGAIWAQSPGARYRIQFTDKHNSPYSLSNPQAYLSARAIQRRTNQGISINESDLPVNPAYIDSIVSRGAVVLNKSKWLNSATVLIADSTDIPQIEALTFVSSVQKTNPYATKSKHKRGGGNAFEEIVFPVSNNYSDMLVSSNYKNEAFKIQYDYGQGLNQASMLGVDYLHSMGFNGQGMIIAVLDAGFYHVNVITLFDSLRNSGRLLGVRDFVNPMSGDPFEESTHGMAVLSTMAANSPGLLVGTAPGASYWLLRSEDAGSEYIIEEDNWIAAAEFADSVGADVINSSLGYTDFDDGVLSHTYQDLDGNTARATRGADIAASKGILVVNSAGNSGNDPWRYIGVPSDADSVLAVGAVDQYGVYASFSSIGPSADGRVKPNVTAQGLGTWVGSVSGDVYPGSGTSFSSPVMAGAVTCLWQANPTFNNMQIIDALQRSANQYSNPDSLYGYGIPNLAIAHMVLSGQTIEKPVDNNLVMVNPNPFEDGLDLIVYSSAVQTIKVELLDASGRVVFSKENQRQIIGYNYIMISGLGSLGSGFYVVRVSGTDWTVSNKILKN